MLAYDMVAVNEPARRRQKGNGMRTKTKTNTGQ